VNG
jgi:hypothetical protein